MALAKIDIEELERAARSFDNPRRVLDLIASIERAAIRDAALLARYHDTLLFLCAYPATPQIRQHAERALKGFVKRVAALGEDIDPLLDPEVSGIAGTSVDLIFSYDFVRWLAKRFPGRLAIDWDDDANPESRATVFTRLVPFLAEEASVDANTPYGQWLEAAGIGIDQLLARLDAPSYDGLQLWIRWTLGNSPMTRTRMRRRTRTVFYQRTPLVSRRDILIERELAGEPLRISRLSRAEGQKVLDMARAGVAMRYRELYCFTFGDPATVVSADCGRGLEIVVIGTLREKRLPLRAAFGAIFFRNGVPIGYADALGLAERMEVSFNIFYAFRSGESALCFARLLKVYHQLFGSTVFSIDPYQIGLDNEEAIAAGAFWFYRKLGFRSVDAAIEKVARREEERIAADPRYRTPARTLRRMASGAMVYGKSTDWDRFHVRNIGLKINRRGIHGRNNLSLVLELLGARRWPGVDDIVRAKSGRTEARFLRLLAKNERLRAAVLRAGR